jgi:hypothetical protein
LTARNSQYYNTITKLVEDCYAEENVDKKILILNNINSIIPESCHVNVPPLITNDFINTALYEIEGVIRRSDKRIEN